MWVFQKFWSILEKLLVQCKNSQSIFEIFCALETFSLYFICYWYLVGYYGGILKNLPIIQKFSVQRYSIGNSKMSNGPTNILFPPFSLKLLYLEESRSKGEMVYFTSSKFRFVPFYILFTLKPCCRADEKNKKKNCTPQITKICEAFWLKPVDIQFCKDDYLFVIRILKLLLNSWFLIFQVSSLILL